jgi:hypothetical protein
VSRGLGKLQRRIVARLRGGAILAAEELFGKQASEATRRSTRRALKRLAEGGFIARRYKRGSAARYAMTEAQLDACAAAREREAAALRAQLGIRDDHDREERRALRLARRRLRHADPLYRELLAQINALNKRLAARGREIEEAARRKARKAPP